MIGELASFISRASIHGPGLESVGIRLNGFGCAGDILAKSVRAVAAAGVTAISSPTMIGFGENQIGTVEVVIFAFNLRQIFGVRGVWVGRCHIEVFL
jgi:hypothetical protein